MSKAPPALFVIWPPDRSVLTATRLAPLLMMTTPVTPPAVPPLPSCSVPALIVVPEWTLLAVRIIVPVPCLAKPPAPNIVVATVVLLLSPAVSPPVLMSIVPPLPDRAPTVVLLVMRNVPPLTVSAPVAAREPPTDDLQDAVVHRGAAGVGVGAGQGQRAEAVLDQRPAGAAATAAVGDGAAHRGRGIVRPDGELLAAEIVVAGALDRAGRRAGAQQPRHVERAAGIGDEPRRSARGIVDEVRRAAGVDGDGGAAGRAGRGEVRFRAAAHRDARRACRAALHEARDAAGRCW